MMADWAVGSGRMVALLLLPFPFLALAAFAYARGLRKTLAQSLLVSSALTRQVAKQDAEAENYKAQLQDALLSHDTLTREFHHRVKNSLQIIQSYLTLSRRRKAPPHNVHLAEAEAKVQVISTAYRLALREGAIAPMPLRSFVQDIVENSQTILCGPVTKITTSIETDAQIVLDRAIPLGLAIIEVITAALGTVGIMQIGIRITKTEADDVSLVIMIDDVFACVLLPINLMRGLQSQLCAHAEPCADDQILNWRFSTRLD